MKITNKNIKELIDSGEYFSEAKLWYNYHNIFPICQQSYLMFALFFVLTIGLYLSLNIYILLPMHKKVPYAVTNNSISSPLLKIKHANEFPNDPYKSIAYILVKNYVKVRESFASKNLVNQLTYVQTNSSKLVYKNYFNYIDTTNPNSPVLRYSNEYNKVIEIQDVITTENPNNMIVNFTSKAIDEYNNVAESITWQADVLFEMDKINNNKDGEFLFSVIDYKVEKIQIIK